MDDQERWRLMGGPLGRVYVDDGVELGLGETVEVVPASREERLREAAQGVLSAWLSSRLGGMADAMTALQEALTDE